METPTSKSDSNGDGATSKAIRSMPADFSATLEEEIGAAGGEWEESEEFKGAVGRTMFDMPSSKDNTVTVLLPADRIAKLPSQSLVRIKSRARANGGDGRQYLGAVVQGPFAEPDGLRADAEGLQQPSEPRRRQLLPVAPLPPRPVLDLS